MSLETETLDRSYTTYYYSSYLTLNIIVALKCGLEVAGRICSHFGDIQCQKMA